MRNTWVSLWLTGQDLTKKNEKLGSVLNVYTGKGASADMPNSRTKHSPFGVIILKVKTIW